MSFLLFPATPADFGIFILTFLFPIQSSHRGHHPGWRLSGSQRFVWLRSQRTERWARIPSPAPCSHTAHMCTHTDGGSSQQKQPSLCTPPALSRIRLATHLPEKMRVSVWGWGMREKPVSTLQTPAFFFSLAPSSFSKMYDSE